MVSKGRDGAGNDDKKTKVSCQARGTAATVAFTEKPGFIAELMCTHNVYIYMSLKYNRHSKCFVFLCKLKIPAFAHLDPVAGKGGQQMNACS